MSIPTFYNNDFATDQNFTLHDLIELGYDLELNDYPIFDEAYRPILNKHIAEHFMFRRIASVTPAMFIYYLNLRMREHMPTINQIYLKIKEEKFDPFANNFGTSWSKQKGKMEGTSGGKSKGEALSTTSTTPQTYIPDFRDPKYLDAASGNVSENETTGESKNTSEGESESGYSGLAGGYAEAIYNLLATEFMNPDIMVFNFLEPLFIRFTDDQPI